ncbi:glycosyl hydrolase-related protein, partial [Mesotoga sp. TolDC]|uniref:glycosyl hydrolase-related protein n=3 Tax=unclassified Mesotoga TaxID=1184398 RepID=UPI0021ACA451
STNALETVAEAESLNKPLVLASGSVDFGKDCLQISAGNLKVLALKHSEGTGYVLRVAEVEGRCGVASVRTSLPFERCWISNILEDKARELPVVDGRVQLEYRQFGLHTLIFE